MRLYLGVICILLLSACGGGGGSVKSDVAASGNRAADLLSDGGVGSRGGIGRPAKAPQDENFGKLLNSYRLASGVGSVSFDSKLNAAAQKHAQDMVDQNYFAHKGRDGRTVGDRVRAEGYDYSFVGEALAARQQSDDEVMKDWKASPSHDAILTDGRAEDFGLGVAGSDGSTKWALVVGAEK